MGHAIVNSRLASAVHPLRFFSCKAISLGLFFVVGSVLSSKATTYYSVGPGLWTGNIWSSACSTCAGGALPALAANDILIIDDYVTISNTTITIGPTVTIFVRTDNSPNTSNVRGKLIFENGGKLKLTSASSKVTLQNLTGNSANNPQIDGSESGASNIIEIGGTEYWRASDGDIQGVGTLQPNGTLPIKLLSFGAKQLENSIELSWITTMEKNFSHFVIERSTESLNFSPITEIEGKGALNARTSYAYIDQSPYRGKNYYRLKSIDYDMSYEYSPVVVVDFRSNQQVIVYPSPSSGEQIKLRLNFSPDEDAQVEVFSNLGVKLAQYSISQLGNDIVLPSGLRAGSYLVRVTSGSFSQIVRFSVI